MFLTVSGVITAQLTRLGRQILADNSANFKITHYAFSDDEIDYANFNSNVSPNPVSLTPILEANTVGGIPSQRFILFSAPKNTDSVAFIDTDISPDQPFIDGEQKSRTLFQWRGINLDSNNYSNLKFTIKSFYAYDPVYFLTPTDIDGTIDYSGLTINAAAATLNSIASTDSFETLQQQSQASVNLPIYTPSLILRYKGPKVKDVVASTLPAWNQLWNTIYSQVPLLSSAEAAAGKWANFALHQSNNTFDSIGLAYRQISIVSSSSRRGCWVNVVIYNSSLILNILNAQ